MPERREGAEVPTQTWCLWDCTTTSGVPSLVLEFKPTFTTPKLPRWVLRLVESEGVILLVSIYNPDQTRLQRHGCTIKKYPVCQVFKLDFNKEWVQINSLGDRVLTVTEFQWMSFSSHDRPEYQRNSVCYQHRHQLCHKEEPSLAIFNMEDGSVKVIKPKRPKFGLSTP